MKKIKSSSEGTRFPVGRKGQGPLDPSVFVVEKRNNSTSLLLEDTNHRLLFLSLSLTMIINLCNFLSKSTHA